MSHERRRNTRVPCRIPAAGPSGPAVIRDVSATGARVVSTAAPKIGARLPLRLFRHDGRSLQLQGAVRRVRARERGGFEIGCSFESHPESSFVAWRMAKLLKTEADHGFVPPPADAPAPNAARRSFSLGDHFTIEGLLFLVIGVTVLLLSSVLAVGYFGAR